MFAGAYDFSRENPAGGTIAAGGENVNERKRGRVR